MNGVKGFMDDTLSLVPTNVAIVIEINTIGLS
jgi:hypothetical protein